VPLATLEIFGQRLPVAGGGYGRLMPGALLIWALLKAVRQIKFPPVYYFHPYDLDSKEFDRIGFKIPRMVKFHQKIGRQKTSDKIKRILNNFRCLSICQAIEQKMGFPSIDYTPYVLKPTDVRRPPIFKRNNAV
jgi:hypothetical protein